MKFTIILFSLIFLQESTTLSPADFQKKVAATKDAVVLDVRTRAEVDKGIIPTAVNVDFKGESFEAQIKKLDKNKTYFVYCAGGTRSEKAVDLMNSLGFKKTYDLDGGFNAWKDEGLKIVK
jgi:rhodanese-related sulfurtransferase